MQHSNSFFQPWFSYVEARRHERSSVVFLKAVMLLVLIRVAHLWWMSPILFYEETIQVPESLLTRIIFLPAYLAPLNIHVFFGVAVAFLLAALVLKPNYFVNVVFFWLTLGLLLLKYPVINGSDYVLVLLAFLSIPLAGLRFIHPLSVGSFNFARLALQWQIVLIYLISGWDKLLSETWRSGAAFVHISNFEPMFNPVLANVIRTEPIPLILCWLTIGFELIFPIVYIKRTRLLILCVGIVFHLVIWLMLGLPDFASVMIISYLIFLQDADYTRMSRLLRQ